MINLDEIAQRLRISRQAMRLSQVALCKRAGIATNTYNQWERGRQPPRIDEAIKLCSLGYTLDWVYRGEKACLPYELVTGIQDLLMAAQKTAAETAVEATPFRSQRRKRA